MPRIVTLLTDFGTADGYVGEMKGVLLSAAPDCTLVDVSHDIAPHDVELGRLVVARYWRRYPAGTVHLAIIDPGVGSDRRAIAVSSDGRFLVGPDNGLLSPALLLPDARAVVLDVPPTASPTFHGRDVFAPAAARLASGAELGMLGAPATNPVVRRMPEPHRDENGDLVGEIIAVDRFGNAVTNLLAGIRGGDVLIDGRRLPLRRTYADLRPGQAGAVVGSAGLIEVVVREGRAADELRIARGTRVVIRPE